MRNGGVSIPSAGLVYKHTDTPVDGIVPDASGQGNDLILKTGWAVTLDGITGQVNFPTESAYDIAGKTLIVSGKFRFSTLPASNYSLIGKGFNLGGWMVYIKSDGRMAFISKRAGLGANHSIKRSTSVCPRDVWNTFTLTAVDGVMTGMVLNGANETIVTDLATAGTYGDYTTADLTIGAIQSVPTSTVTYFFAGDLCDFSMTVDGVEILKPKLQDHPPGSLDGLPAFDASGNGNHGTYVGGTSINGEGMPDYVAKLGDYESNYFLNGTSQSVQGAIPINWGASVDVEVSTYFTGTRNTILGNTITKNSGWIYWGAGYINLTLGGFTIGSNRVQWGYTLPLNTHLTFRVLFDGVDTAELFVNGVSRGTRTASGPSSLTTYNTLLLGRSQSADYSAGVFYDLTVNGTYYAIAEGNLGTGVTLNGSPVTVGDLRRTIPQTALQDWNTYGTLSYAGIQDFVASSVEFPEGNFTLNLASGTGFYGMNMPTGVASDVVVVKGTILITSGSPGLSLRSVPTGGAPASNLVVLSSSGEFEITLTATGSFSYLSISEADLPAEYTFTNLRVEFAGKNAFIPASLADPSQDALGNDIDNPRGELLNPRGVAGDYAEILYDPSLDVTTEWSGALVGNLWDDGALNRLVLHRDDFTNSKKVFNIAYRSSADSATDGRVPFILSSTGAVNAWSGRADLPNRNSVLSWSYNGTAGTFKVYIDGAETTVTTVFGTIPASLFTTNIPIRLFQNFNGVNPSDKQIGKTLMYNKALSDSEHVKIYRALRRYL